MPVRVLIACEESQVVTKAFRRMGIEAYSCDILPCSGGHPEWHIQGDVIPLLYKRWDMIIAFPPCDHLAVSGAKHFKKKIEDGRQAYGIAFFLLFTKLKCKKVVIENPKGIMSTYFRKPDQIIHPYHFGDSFKKQTCLWLKGVPKLKETNIVNKGDTYICPKGNKIPKWYNTNSKKNKKIRSKTFEGIAGAMAKQWGTILLNEKPERIKLKKKYEKVKRIELRRAL